MEKKSVLQKKSKIAHNFFVTKAADLKTIFLKSPFKMHVDTYVTLWYLFKTKQKKMFLIFYPF